MAEAENDATDSAPGVDPRRLMIFREIARRGSLSAAAAALGWTQPAVGQHLQRLERDLGLSLALRTTRGVALTDAGTRLLTHADAVASRLTIAAEEMSSLRTLRTGHLRLAAFPSACATLVPKAMAKLAQVAPDVDVWLTEAEPPQARSTVLAGDADLAVLFSHRGSVNADSHPDLVCHELLEDPVRAVVSRRHRLGEQPPPPPGVPLAELSGDRWIAGCPRCRTHLESLAASAGFRPDIRHTTDDYVVVQTLVAAGLAVALLPALALSAATNQQVIALPIEGTPTRRVTLIHRREALAVPAVQAAVHAFKSAPID